MKLTTKRDTLFHQLQTVTRAASTIDKFLAFEPEQVGESRTADRRILLEPPLGVIYEVSIPDRTVSVLTVWQFRQRREGEGESH